MPYTAPVYPTAIPSLTDLPSYQDITDTIYSFHHNDMKEELRSALNEIGVLPKGTYASLRDRVDNLLDKGTGGTVNGVLTVSANFYLGSTNTQSFYPNAKLGMALDCNSQNLNNVKFGSAIDFNSQVLNNLGDVCVLGKAYQNPSSSTYYCNYVVTPFFANSLYDSNYRLRYDGTRQQIIWSINGTGEKYFDIDISKILCLFGASVRIKSFTVYVYFTGNSDYIKSIYLYKNNTSSDGLTTVYSNTNGGAGWGNGVSGYKNYDVISGQSLDLVSTNSYFLELVVNNNVSEGVYFLLGNLKFYWM
jgi:hypothetical protein